MEQYFKDFEEKLSLAEEKLDILSEWHITKGHKGATEIAEDCRTAITQLWFEFYRLSERYKKAEASHEEALQSNLDNLLGALKRYDDERAEEWEKRYKEQPEWLLFNYINKASKEINGITHNTASIWFYLRDLIRKDLKEKELQA